MAIKKSIVTGGMQRRQMPSPVAAFAPASVIVSHAFTEALATTDILELAVLPPNCKIVSADLMTEGTAAITFTVGFMSGDAFSSDAARTSGSELLSAATPTTMASASLAALAALAPVDYPRSIGVKASALVALNAATKLHLRLNYVTGIN